MYCPLSYLNVEPLSAKTVWTGLVDRQAHRAALDRGQPHRGGEGLDRGSGVVLQLELHRDGAAGLEHAGRGAHLVRRVVDRLQEHVELVDDLVAARLADGVARLVRGGPRSALAQLHQVVAPRWLPADPRHRE